MRRAKPNDGAHPSTWKNWESQVSLVANRPVSPWHERSPIDTRDVCEAQKIKCGYCNAKCKVILKDSVESGEGGSAKWCGVEDEDKKENNVNASVPSQGSVEISPHPALENNSEVDYKTKPRDVIVEEKEEDLARPPTEPQTFGESLAETGVEHRHISPIANLEWRLQRRPTPEAFFVSRM